MTKIRNNPLLKGASGMLGKVVVFRQLRGRTIMANRPRPARRQSDLQRTNRKRFRDATQFAKAAMRDPKKKAFYWEMARDLSLPNAYTAAITEYMRNGKPAVNPPSLPAGKPGRKGKPHIMVERSCLTTDPATITQPLTSYPPLVHADADCRSWTVNYSSTLWRWTVDSGPWTISSN